ncbi:MAG: sulfite exporter TauE/SafE family protein [Promethearchaeota archaeon]
MDYYQMLIWSAIIGLLAGFLSGMLGIGGGSIRIPLLNLIGFTLLTSFGINLMVIPLSSLFGVYSHRESLQLKSGFYLAFGGSLGTILGVIIVLYLVTSEFSLAIIFFLASLLTVIGLNLYKFAPNFAQKFNPTPINIITGGFFLNIITGMKGGSGGSLFPPLLRFLKFDIHKAIATSLFATIFTAIVGFIMFGQRGEIVWLEGLIVLLGSIIGVRLGSLLSVKTKSTALEVALSIIVILMALITVFKAIL